MRSTRIMRPPRPDDATPVTDPVALRSETWLRFFRYILERQLRRSFHAVRIARPGLPAISNEWPLIVYFNHPSWWEGALVPVLVDRLFPRRRAFGPIDADALKRYGFMRRLGFFGVQADSFSGAATFLRVGRRLLAERDTLFCITPEGRFVDARVRPVRLQPGLVGLLSGVPRVTVLPLAVEYPFWSERTPEALARFGEPLVVGTDVAGSLDDVGEALGGRLAAAMDRLADDAIARDPARFDTLLEGRVGVGGFYDLGRRLKAWSRGERFDAAHAFPAVPRRDER